MELETVKYLRSGHTLEELKKNYLINYGRSKDFPSLVGFSYGIDAPMREQICKECRGLVLDEAKNWEIACLPFYKFWDYGTNNIELDLKTVKAYTKEDGTLCTIYYAYGQWNVCTTGSCDASGNVCTVLRHQHDFSFATLFWRVFNELGYKLPEDTSHCYMFELCTEYNTIIVHHEKPRLVYLGSRNLKTLQEYFPEYIGDKYNWECVKMHPMQSVEQIIALAESFSPKKSEGFILVDDNFTRAKVKSEKYKTIADALDGLIADRRILEHVRGDGLGELLSYCPYIKDKHDFLEAEFLSLVQMMQAQYDAIKDIADDKQFAMLAMKSKVPGALFNIRKKINKNAREYFRHCHMNIILRALGIK